MICVVCWEYGELMANIASEAWHGMAMHGDRVQAPNSGKWKYMFHPHMYFQRVMIRGSKASNGGQRSAP